MKNQRRLYTILTLILTLSPTTDYAADSLRDKGVSDILQSIKADTQHFYSAEQWTRLGIAFGVGGVMANTSADQAIQDWYQDHVRNSSTDDFAAVVKEFGGWKYMVPVSLAAAGIGLAFPQNTGSTIGAWGEKTFRAYLVAAPAMFVGQHLTGASRPGERDNASHWRPFHDNNGVSGHAFTGAVPFITLAKMTRNPFIRYASYAASVLTAWSRVNDNAHYTSQVLLGWYIGYAAADAVATSSSGEKPLNLQFSLIPRENGAEARVVFQW